PCFISILTIDVLSFFLFFFNDSATTEIYTLSLHDALPISEEIRLRVLPRSRLRGEANLLVMPTLDAANIAFNLLKTASGGGVTIGPILLGAARPVHILTPSATVRRVVNMTAVTVAGANASRGQEQ